MFRLVTIICAIQYTLNPAGSLLNPASLPIVSGLTEYVISVFRDNANSSQFLDDENTIAILDNEHIKRFGMTILFNSLPEEMLEKNIMHTAKVQDFSAKSLIASMKKANDEAIALRTFREWYANIPPAHRDLKQKVANLHTILTNLNISNQTGSIVDMGSGDCQFVTVLSKMMGLKGYGVDVPNGEEHFAHQNDEASSDGHTITKIKYQYTPDDLQKQLMPVAKKEGIQMVTYIYSLHHFAGYENQRDSLKTIFRLMNKNGILVVKEHDLENRKDQNINLQHLLLGAIGHSAKNTTCAAQFHYNNICDLSQRTDYTSEELLKDWAQEIGFEHIATTAKSRANNGYYSVFRKN